MLSPDSISQIGKQAPEDGHDIIPVNQNDSHKGPAMERDIEENLGLSQAQELLS